MAQFAPVNRPGSCLRLARNFLATAAHRQVALAVNFPSLPEFYAGASLVGCGSPVVPKLSTQPLGVVLARRRIAEQTHQSI